MKTLALAVVLAALSPFPADAQQQRGTSASAEKMKPEELLQWFYDMNQHEVRMGALGMEKASSPEVKQFAQTMMNDHTNVSKKIEELGKQMKMSYKGKPTPTPADRPWRETQQKVYDALQKVPTDRFDSAFLSSMVMGHDWAISRLENAHQQMKSAGTNPQLTDMIAQTLPTMRQHRQHAYQLLGQAGPASASAARMGTTPGMGTMPPSGSGAARTGQETPPQQRNR